MEHVIQYQFDINMVIQSYLNIIDMIQLNKIKQCEKIISHRNNIIFESGINDFISKFDKTTRNITMWINYHKPNFNRKNILFLKLFYVK